MSAGGIAGWGGTPWIAGWANSSTNWQYLPVNPGLQAQIKSGRPFEFFGVGIVLVGIQVPPDKHGLFEQLSGKKQLLPVVGEQHDPVKISHKKHEPGDPDVEPVHTQS